jgi:hypothetical protein
VSAAWSIIFPRAVNNENPFISHPEMASALEAAYP